MAAAVAKELHVARPVATSFHRPRENGSSRETGLLKANNVPTSPARVTPTSTPFPTTRNEPAAAERLDKPQKSLSSNSSFETEPSQQEFEKESDGPSSPSGSTSHSSEENTQLLRYPGGMNFPIKPSYINRFGKYRRQPTLKRATKRRIIPPTISDNQEGDDEDAASSIPETVPDETASSTTSGNVLRELWTKLDLKRREIRELRLRMSQQRAELQHLRRLKDDADNALMSFLRPRLATPSRASHISEEFIFRCIEGMQTARDHYNFAESEYEMLEADLDREEADFAVIESDFFTFLFKEFNDQDLEDLDPETLDDEDGEDDDDSDDCASRTTLLGISPERPADIHPLYHELLDAVGDRDLAAELHSEMLLRRRAILYNLEMKLTRDVRGRDEIGRLGGSSSFVSEKELDDIRAHLEEMTIDDLLAQFTKSIPKADVEFLREYEDGEKDAREKLSAAQERIDKLRTQCIEQGVMQKHLSLYEEHTIYSRADDPFPPKSNITLRGTEDQEESRTSEKSLVHRNFSILLSNSAHVLGDPPLTAKGALRAVMKLPRDEPSWNERYEEAKKEFGIETLIEQFKEGDKLDFINRWLLHRLRTSKLETLLLYTIFTEHVRILNLWHWQEDVLYFWPRDSTDRAPNAFDGPVTADDDLVPELDDSDFYRSPDEIEPDLEAPVTEMEALSVH